jgi:hypothetical protein
VPPGEPIDDAIANVVASRFVLWTRVAKADDDPDRQRRLRFLFARCLFGRGFFLFGFAFLADQLRLQ